MTNNTLEGYLAGEFHHDSDDIRDLERALSEAALVFKDAQRDGIWPYALDRRVTERTTPSLSHGTQAMIATALARACDQARLPSGRKARVRLSDAEEIAKVLALGLSVLGASLKDGLRSGSFGRNDPVTLSHFVELARSLDEPGDLRAAFQTALKPAVEILSNLATTDPRDGDFVSNEEEPGRWSLPIIETRLGAIDSENALHLPNEAGTLETSDAPEASHTPESAEAPATREAPEIGHRPDYLVNAFVALRVARSITGLKALGLRDELISATAISTHKKIYRRFFESTLHEQLSYSDIPDSRFDPAEMIFCLEGLMLTAPNLVDDRLFERVLSVLEAKQEESAHWRPSRPLYATKQGMTLLPVSVEGAVSLLRAITIKDRFTNYQPLSSRTAPMARRFWKWLQARAVRFSSIGSDRQLRGWHSEHVNDPELIHLWDTSQVVEFMLAYRELLQNSIAGRTLLLSRLKIDRPTQRPPTDVSAYWDAVIAESEPAPGCVRAAQVYTRLKDDFILWWSKGRPTNYSMLLYGPPGTGKSTLAENVAKALGMRMVTVTVSDFLGSGGENVEARAKAIFQTLEAQFETVILFDEIDAFLLDRDSDRYAKQQTLFQFLTPGMLTKINDLRKLKRSIFIIATNYEGRIDPAIKRRGRIDQHYLLPLPNAAARRRIVKSAGIEVPEEQRRDLAAATLFFGYSDLLAAIANAGEKPTAVAVTGAAEQLGRPSVLESYLRRIQDNRGTVTWDDVQREELTGLVRLLREVTTEEEAEKVIEQELTIKPQLRAATAKKLVSQPK